MGLQSTDKCFCGNAYGSYGELEDEECGVLGNACGQNSTDYPKDSCQLANVVFVLPRWT